MATLPTWANLEFLVIESNPQYITDPDTGAIVVQPGWFEVTTSEQLAEVQQQIQSLTPVPPSPADWDGWRYGSMMYFESVFNAVSVVAPFRANSLMNLLMSAPNVDMGNMIGMWNETMGMIDTAGLNFVAINDSAIAHHIPLRIDGNGVITVA